MDKEQLRGIQKPIIVQPLRKSLGCQTQTSKKTGYKNILVSKTGNLHNASFVHGKGGKKTGKHLAVGRTKGSGRKWTFLEGSTRGFQIGLTRELTPWSGQVTL